MSLRERLSSPDFETARRDSGVNTVLFYGSANYLTEQRLSDQARFGMPAGRGSEGAAVAANKMLAIALFERRGPAEIFQDAKSGFDSLVPRLAFDREPMIIRDPSADFAHGCAQFLWSQLF